MSTVPDLSMFQGRRLRPDELAAVVRNRAGVELLPGLHRLVDAHACHTADGRWPIASAAHLSEAHLIRQEPGAQLTWETARVPADLGRRSVVFAFPMAMGNGSAMPQPSGQFDLSVDGRRLLAFTLTKDSLTWSDRGASLHFDARHLRASAFGAPLVLDEQLGSESVFVDGMGLLLLPRELVTPGARVRLQVVANQREPSRNWFRLGRPLHPFLTDHLEPGLTGLLRPQRPAEAGAHHVLFGDLHSHSTESRLRDDDGCGTGFREELFAFARDVAGLDLFCLSEHDWQMNDDDWKDLVATSERYDDPGRFVTPPGYEWTSANYGHRNIYFRESGASMFSSLGPGVARNDIVDTSPRPDDLWRHLDGEATTP